MTTETLMIETTQSIEKKSQRSYTSWLIGIVILLTILILLNGYQLYSTYQQNQLAAQRAATYEERAKEVTDLANSQQALLLKIINEYQDDAYGVHVDRIAEQQLIATEYTMELLQIMAIQNTQIMSLLANQP